MGLFSRAGELFRGRRRRARARAEREEALGQLEEATAHYLEAEAPQEAARVFALRADATFDMEKRHLLLGQAVRLAVGEQAKALEARRSELTLELIRSGALRLSRAELAEVAARLERAELPARAAEVYALMGDKEGQARVLVEAGAIEKLESVLDAAQAEERAERKKTESEERVRDLAGAGRRREALELGRTLKDLDGLVADLLVELEARRVNGPRARLELDGRLLDVIFGDTVTIGRAGASLVVPTPGISREHLALCRGPNGPEARDLGSRNGTFLGGARLDVPVQVGSGIELTLGGEVKVILEPWASGGVKIALGEEVVHAPLGPLEVGSWRVAPGIDGWLELDAPTPACLAALKVQGIVQLGRGDALSESLNGPVRLRVPA